ncbi:MAG: DUF6438 domain-containing protein [Fimbriiglobus sp.]
MTMNHAEIYELSLSRGPCFGSCPIFRFSASRRYGYSYRGIGFVEPLGQRVGKFPGYLFDRLAELCLDLRVMELEDFYPTDFDDTAYTILAVKFAGGVKTVRDEGASASPVRLWAFAQLMEHCMREAFAIEDRAAESAPKPYRPTK